MITPNLHCVLKTSEIWRRPVSAWDISPYCPCKHFRQFSWTNASFPFVPGVTLKKKAFNVKPRKWKDVNFLASQEVASPWQRISHKKTHLSWLYTILVLASAVRNWSSITPFPASAPGDNTKNVSIGHGVTVMTMGRNTGSLSSLSFSLTALKLPCQEICENTLWWLHWQGCKNKED